MYTGWNVKPVAITFNRNTTDTGSANGSVTTLTRPFDGTIGSGMPTVVPGIPTRPGYTFEGWATTAGATSVNFTASTALTIANGVQNASTSPTLTLYAVWMPNTYTINFNANGGTGTVSPWTGGIKGFVGLPKGFLRTILNLNQNTP